MPKFEAQWFEEENFKEIIHNAWEKEVNVHGKEVGGAMKGVLG
jgi:hypothetical protein